MKHASTSLLDASAIGLSGLCLIHCLALPLVAAFSPAVAAWAQAEWAHAVLVAAAAPLSALALWRRGQSLAVILLGLTGLGLLVCAVGGWPERDLETPVTVAGSMVLAAAHLVNWRRRRHGCPGVTGSQGL